MSDGHKSISLYYSGRPVLSIKAGVKAHVAEY